MHVCDERDDASYDLAVCTQIMATDVEHRPDHLAVWLGYHFAQGADRVIVCTRRGRSADASRRCRGRRESTVASLRARRE